MRDPLRPFHLRFIRAELVLLARLRSRSSTKATVSPVPERCGADQHRHAAAVLPDVLLLEDFTGAGGSNLGHGPLAGGSPFCEGQICPPEWSRRQVLRV